MNAKYFYVYIILGMIFVGLIIYNLIEGRTGTTLIYDGIIVLLCFYRAYRVYMSKKDQELM